MIPLYTLCTPSHRELKERFFLPTLPGGLKLHMLDHASEGVGLIMDPGWRATIVRKVEWIIEAVEQHWNAFFLFSDIDVQFFGPIGEAILEAAERFDISFQRDTPSSLCTGFFVCRGNDATLDLWRKVLDRVRETNGFKHDQESIQQRIGGSAVRWGFLPLTFFGGGTLTARIWNPGDELPVPDGIVMHHANFTCGVPNKIKQCEYVRGKVFAAAAPEHSATTPGRHQEPFLRA
jgi:hypothetical protein